MISFSDNMFEYLQLGRTQCNFREMCENNKKTYENKLVTVLNEMKVVNDDLDKKKFELEKIKEKQKELTEMHAMQYEEKLQIIIEKRLLHSQKLLQICSNINDEELKKKELIKKQQIIVNKMKDIMHVQDLLLTN